MESLKYVVFRVLMINTWFINIRLSTGIALWLNQGSKGPQIIKSVSNRKLEHKIIAFSCSGMISLIPNSGKKGSDQIWPLEEKKKSQAKVIRIYVCWNTIYTNLLTSY